MSYPVLSVLDNSTETTVIWHVHTHPVGLPTGAWIAEEDQVANLLADTVIILTPGSSAPENSLVASLEGIQGGVDKQVAAYNQHGVRVAGLGARGAEAVYRGEPAAEAAWRAAMELLDVVNGWNDIESKRRSRKVLAEAFGAEVQPLPLDAN